MKLLRKDIHIVFRSKNLFFDGVKEFIVAYEALNKKHSGNKFLSMKYYLLGHALELLLKGYLFKNGMTKERLKNKLGHNLKKSLELCESKGLGDVTPQIKANVALLSKSYKAKDFEYLRYGSVELPDFTDVEAILKRLGKKIMPNTFKRI